MITCKTCMQGQLTKNKFLRDNRVSYSLSHVKVKLTFGICVRKFEEITCIIVYSKPVSVL